VITLPALEWDGQLGPEERVAIVRVGFLLNAYQVCLVVCVCAFRFKLSFAVLLPSCIPV